METRDGDRSVSIPRGGPIFVQDMAGPLTTVPDFQSSLLHQIQDLEAQLCLDDSTLSSENYISVNDLRTFTEEELADIALKEAFKEEKEAGENTEESPEQRRSSSRIAAKCKGNTDGIKVSRALTKNNARKKRKTSNDHIEEPYIPKVKQLASIKMKQDEDKLSARLHCLRANKNYDKGTPFTESTEIMQPLRSTTPATKRMSSSGIEESKTVRIQEIILSIEIYHNTNRLMKTQEFLVLGNQRLTELRDNISCLTDQVMEKAGQHDHSGYFLIEDVFCNDLRNPSAEDYSIPIFHWLRNSKDEAQKKWECILTGELRRKQKQVLGEVQNFPLPEFKAVDMHQTRFCDIKFRLGAGYLYCHQGDCKHMIVIRDMRLTHPEDVKARAAYPIMTYRRKSRVEKCKVCRIHRATKVIFNDRWAEDNPCFFCDYCCALLHPDPDDGSVSSNDVKVYEYLHT